MNAVAWRTGAAIGLLLGCLVSAAVAQAPDSTHLRQLRQQAQQQSETEPAQARATLTKALVLARQTKFERGERAVLNDLATLCGRLNELAAAQRYVTAATRLAETARDTFELGRAYLTAANLNRANDRPALEQRYAELACQQFGRAPRLAPWLFRAQTTLARAYLSQGQVAAAKKVYRPALRSCRRLGNPDEEFRLLIGLAPLLQRYEPDSAGALLTQARTLADTRLKVPYPRAYVRANMAALAWQQHRWSEMLPLAREAVGLARQAKADDIELTALELMGEGLRQRGENAAAFDTLRRAYQLHETLEGRRNQAALQQLQVRFDVAQQQGRIQQLEQRRRIADLQATQQQARTQALTVATTVLLAVLLAVGLLLTWALRQRRRLQASKAALQAANHTKDQLIRIVGHDLRSPMASLQQLTPLLHDVIEQPERATAHALIRTLDAGAQHLGGMVDNLFQWARAQGGQLINHPEALHVVFAASSITALYGPTATLKNIALETAVAPGLLVWADLGLLTAVLRNLVGNALKFTPQGGRVLLTAQPAANGRVEISVLDTGPGLAPALLAHLRTADRLPSTPGTAGEPGTGLGLPLSASFVRLMGGELHLEAGPTGGTRAWFRLPAAAD